MVERLDHELWPALPSLLLSDAASQLEVHEPLKCLVVQIVGEVETILDGEVVLAGGDCLQVVVLGR